MMTMTVTIAIKMSFLVKGNFRNFVFAGDENRRQFTFYHGELAGKDQAVLARLWLLKQSDAGVLPKHLLHERFRLCVECMTRIGLNANLLRRGFARVEGNLKTELDFHSTYISQLPAEQASSLVAVVMSSFSKSGSFDQSKIGCAALRVKYSFSVISLFGA